MFKNPDYLLAPNQYVKLVLTSKKAEKKLAIPQAAVMSDITGEYIYVVDNQNSVIRKSVVTTAKKGTEVFIASDKVEAGEMVIHQGTQKAIPGKTVTTKTATPTTEKE